MFGKKKRVKKLTPAQKAGVWKEPEDWTKTVMPSADNYTGQVPRRSTSTDQRGAGRAQAGRSAVMAAVAGARVMADGLTSLECLTTPQPVTGTDLPDAARRTGVGVRGTDIYEDVATYLTACGAPTTREEAKKLCFSYVYGSVLSARQTFVIGNVLPSYDIMRELRSAVYQKLSETSR